ncbi:1-deoxy-D-xylulose-5-phosphate synthase [Streptomyces sp. BI20]|uniref:1-deoxy-D-xylulose-5-phosphate synthase n=1 Tax=Streptomyces sp. BI20 TaxID=3403460 RepID=UPI003C741B90
MHTPDLPGADVGAPLPSAPGSPCPDPAHVLAEVGDPARLRRLPAERLPELAARLRAFLVEQVSATGGHLGASLGTVELSIALHRVFDSPRDAILFDTGHQAYAHKVLTGRAAGFEKLRARGGMSGYPSRAESPHDWIENSHASTAPGYADGLAKAFALRGSAGAGRRVVAVLGDGALGGGVALEALNCVGAGSRPVVVVLNDNGRSYDPTVGGLARHLAELRSRPPASDAGPVRPEYVFETLGFTCLGPVPGHDPIALEEALRTAAAIAGPVLVHVVTAKGHGYPPAEHDEDDRMHAVGVIDPLSGRPVAAPAATWTDVFGAELLDLAGRRPDLVAITAAMRLPTGLGPFSERHPDRCFDVGIAEQLAVTSAAGLAMGGLHPVVCVYATFLGRACDQVLMDVALHRLPVTFVLDRAGVTGPDGPSHHGMWDLALLSGVPGMRVAAPRDPARLREELAEAVAHGEGPTAVRYPKAAAGPDLTALDRLADGTDVLARPAAGRRSDVLLVAVGATAPAVLDAAADLTAEGLGVTVVDPRWVLPIGPSVRSLALRHRLVVCVEDGLRSGGVGSLLAQECADAADPGGPAPRVLALGLPTAFLAHAGRPELLAEHGLTGPGIAASVRAALPARPVRRPKAPTPRISPENTAAPEVPSTSRRWGA